MMRLSAFLATTAALATVLPGLAFAGSAPAPAITATMIPYVAFGSGVNFAQDPSVSYVSDNYCCSARPTITKIDGLNAGYVIFGAVGIDFLNGWRSELEASYRRNNGARFNIQGEGSASLGIDKSTFALLTNLWRDFQLTEDFSAHVGGGLGIGYVNLSTNITSPGLANRSSDLSHTGLAYMAGVGVDYKIPGWSNVKLTLDYRIMGVTGGGDTLNVPGSFNTPGDRTVVVKVGGAKIDQSIMLGLRIPLNPM